MNIELHTLAEVQGVSGEEGNFTVTVRKSPRYVDMDKCIACGECAAKCPKKVDSEYNEGTDKRKAIYIPYGQSVPLKYAIDPNNCIMIQKGKCGACEKACPTQAVNFGDKEEIVELNVGSMILTPGFKAFDPSGYDYLYYDKAADVVTSLEYERLLSANGPCMGHLVRPSDKKEPSKIAWLQCVGSRDENRCGNGFCSSVCCMYAIKQSLMTAEHTTGPCEQTILYMDIRSHGKEFEKYYEGAKKSGVNFVQARPHTILPGPDGKGAIIEYADKKGQMVSEEFDMVVLSIGLEAPKDAKDLSGKLGFKLNKYGFAETSSFTPVLTSRDGIYASGAFHAPMDIPQAVTDASSAAAGAAVTLAEARGTLTQEKTYPAETDISGQEPRIGVFVCSCGTNIAGTVDVKAVCDYSATLPNVVFVENNLFTCSTDTQEIIAGKIKEHGLNRIVVAACTPRTHEPLFKDTLREAGLNEYLVEMANIRNQNSWVHQNDPENATAKAKDQVRMAVAKAAILQPLEKMSVDVTQKALVIGGGMSGMTSALGIADMGYDVVLLEKSDTLGGNAWSLSETWRGEAIKPELQAMIGKVENHDRITVLKKAALKTAVGSVGNFVSEVNVDGQSKAVKYGVAVVATGAREYKPNEYLYGENDAVKTHLEFDALIESGQAKNADSVVFIQCVGSRDSDRPYCSRVCCTHTVESAIRLKEMKPEMNVYVLNRDIRTFGLREDLYTKARKLGVIFIKYTLDNKPRVAAGGSGVKVTATDHILDRPLEIGADYLVLATAIVPNQTEELVELYKCSVGEDGFITEAHPKLRPVDMSVDGLFVAGLCHYPKPIDEAVAQAQAATSRAGVLLARTEMPLDSIKSVVTEKCDGCALCVDTCPYNAIKLEDYEDDKGKAHRRIFTDKALCKGCGVCMATCPKGGVNVSGFTMEQLKAQVYSALEGIS